MKEHPSIHSSFTKFDDGFQKEVLQSIKTNPKLLDDMLSRKSLIDEFVEATSKTPLLAENVSFFSHFITHPQFAADLVLKQTDNAVDFLSKTDGKLLAKYKDGILDIAEPFAKDGRTFSNIILTGDFIPNTLYKVRGHLGSSYRIQTDALGNIVTADMKRVKPEDVSANLLKRNANIDLGPTWTSSFNRIKQASKQGDVDVSLHFFYTEGNPNPRSVKVTAQKGGKSIVDKLFENRKHIVKSNVSSSVAESSTKFYKDSGEPLTEAIIRDATKQHAGFDNIINAIFKENSYLKIKDFIIKKGPRGGDMITHKSSPRISMEIKGDMVYASSGSHVNTNGLNDFLNYLLPNKTYVIDDCFQFKTDGVGNVVEAIADRTKAKNLPKRTTPHGPTQGRVSGKGLPGDQSGHLFARHTNGPNEAINQVPMEAHFNMHGEWRDLEKIEEKALSEGKKVISRRKLIYDNPKSGRPSAIIFEYEIDGVKNSVRLVNPIPQGKAA